MQEEIIYNAAVYARLSKEDERAGDSVSIESQVFILIQTKIFFKVLSVDDCRHHTQFSHRVLPLPVL